MHVVSLKPIDRLAPTNQPAVVLTSIPRAGEQCRLVDAAEPAYRITRS
jgi:hypothetical protein